MPESPGGQTGGGNRWLATVSSMWSGVHWAWDHSIGWLLKWMLILPIRAYQRVISPLTRRAAGCIRVARRTRWRASRCMEQSKASFWPHGDWFDATLGTGAEWTRCRHVGTGCRTCWLTGIGGMERWHLIVASKWNDGTSSFGRDGTMTTHRSDGMASRRALTCSSSIG